jgi:hypothetical protein
MGGSSAAMPRRDVPIGCVAVSFSKAKEAKGLKNKNIMEKVENIFSLSALGR